MTSAHEPSSTPAVDFNYLQSVHLLAVQRVKVYRLNDEGRWDDKGTGHVSVEYLERSDALGMVVIDEEDNNTLLVHRISADDIYRRQEDTIISWTDPEIATDLALSFQEAMGCGFIWEQICNVQRSVNFTNAGGVVENGSRIPNDELEHSGTSQDDDDVLHDNGSSEIPELPGVELASLPQIVKIVAEVSYPDKERVAKLILRDQAYIPKLMELFRICEDLENAEGLHMLFRIVKGLISLNDRGVYGIIFSDELIMDIVGALEFDPELSSQQDHRSFLKNQVVFKEAVPIREPAIVSKIHQTYRVGYIKDVILPRVLDDQTMAALNLIMTANNKTVVTALQADKSFLTELFNKLRQPDVADSIRNDLLLFLYEFCNLSKNLLSYSRGDLLGFLVEKGIFDVITTALQSPDSSVNAKGCDILIVVLTQEPTLLRNFLVQQPGHVLFSLLVKVLLSNSEGGLQLQVLEILKMLMESEQQQPEKSPYLDVFYEKYMDQLVEVFATACPAKSDLKRAASGPEKASVSGEVLGNLCEFMCFCVLHHGYRMKYYVMRNNVVEKVLRLVRRKEKVLVVAAVRFLRSCVGLKDEFYDRYLVKNKLFEPVIQAFLANGSRYNLLNSTVLELIDFIQKSNQKTLIAHLVETYGEKLDVVDYVDTIKQLKHKYEQALEISSAPARETAVGSGAEPTSDRFIGPFPDLRKRKDDRALDKDEETYFNEDSDDEEDSANVSTASASITQTISVNGVLEHVSFSPFGLVDYDDEDEDSLVPWATNGKGFPHHRKADELPVSDIWPPDLMNKRKPQHPLEISFQKRPRQEGPPPANPRFVENIKPLQLRIIPLEARAPPPQVTGSRTPEPASAVKPEAGQQKQQEAHQLRDENTGSTEVGPESSKQEFKVESPAPSPAPASSPASSPAPESTITTTTTSTPTPEPVKSEAGED